MSERNREDPFGPITLREVLDAVQAAANDTRASAEAAVKAGFRATPDRTLMRRVEALDAAEKFLSAVYPYWDKVGPFVRRLRDGFAR